MDLGSAGGRKAGVSHQKLMLLTEYETHDMFSDLERLCLRFADGLTQTPSGIEDALWDQLAAALNEAQLVELAMTVAWENHRARFSRAFNLQSEGFGERAVCVLPAPRVQTEVEVP